MLSLNYAVLPIYRLLFRQPVIFMWAIVGERTAGPGAALTICIGCR